MRLSYAVENIRRLKNIPDVELRPLTLLVGRNSAGKSTFLRSFPLIRQSLEIRSSAPILWFGDLVDFGDLTSALGDNDTANQVAFRFTLHNIEGKERPTYFASRGYYWYQEPIQFDTVSMRSVIGARGDETVMQLLEISIPREKIEVQIDFRMRSNVHGAITVNGNSVEHISKKFDIRATNRSLFSQPIFIQRRSSKDTPPVRPSSSQEVLADALVNTFRRWATRRIGKDTLWTEAQRVLSQATLDEHSIRQLMGTSRTKTFRRLYSQILSPTPTIVKEETISIHRLARALAALEVFQEQLTEYFLNVNYLGPVRAASERYYRKQELEVSEIAPNGANFPMFLASLSPWELQQFSTWVGELFGYGVKVHRSGGHISIHLHAKEKSINVTDTGYGVSQILPVLGIIWWATHGRSRSVGLYRQRSGPRTLAIEQPELHLHPAHQAKLADVFAYVIGNEKSSLPRRRKTSFIIETHSEALINRLGELVEQGKVNSDAIQIVIFSAHDDLSTPTEVRFSSYDNKGALKNWPYGFFRYSDR